MPRGVPCLLAAACVATQAPDHHASVETTRRASASHTVQARECHCHSPKRLVTPATLTNTIVTNATCTLRSALLSLAQELHKELASLDAIIQQLPIHVQSSAKAPIGVKNARASTGAVYVHANRPLCYDQTQS